MLCFLDGSNHGVHANCRSAWSVVELASVSSLSHCSACAAATCSWHKPHTVHSADMDSTEPTLCRAQGSQRDVLPNIQQQDAKGRSHVQERPLTSARHQTPQATQAVMGNSLLLTCTSSLAVERAFPIVRNHHHEALGVHCFTVGVWVELKAD